MKKTSKDLSDRARDPKIQEEIYKTMRAEMIKGADKAIKKMSKKYDCKTVDCRFIEFLLWIFCEQIKLTIPEAVKSFESISKYLEERDSSSNTKH